MSDLKPTSSHADLTDYTALALAGVVQAAELVHATANAKSTDPDTVAAVLAAVTTQNASALSDVMPHPSHLRLGVNAAVKALSGAPDNPESVRYTLELIDLATRLKRSGGVTARLRELLDALPPEGASIAELAAVYQKTISTLGKRIQVTGDPQTLQREPVADEIRALLLAGVRFAWLWHQRGGRRWHLIAQRGRLLEALQALQHIL